MHVEDLIIMLSWDSNKLNHWDRTLVESFKEQIYKDLGLTEKQNNIALTILKKHIGFIESRNQKSMIEFINTPTHRLGIRKLNNTKRISIVDHPEFYKAIKVEFPFNQDLVTTIRQKRDFIGVAVWDKDQKAWFFSLNEQSIQFLMELATSENFEVDDVFLKYSNQTTKINNSLENYVPMLVLENNKPILKNCSEFVPILDTTNIIEAAFLARRYGVTTWCTEINNLIDSGSVNPCTKTFLKSEYTDILYINSNTYQFSDLSDIIKFMSPCLFVIPGGLELEKTEGAYQFLKSVGIQDNEMSVMFRLPSDNGGVFNNFVKNNNLNSPITEQTQIVFISSKLPKPVIKSKIQFRSVINLGFDNVHYTMKEFVKTHENLIFYTGNLKDTGVQVVNV